jgi:hypothetical protein
VPTIVLAMSESDAGWDHEVAVLLGAAVAHHAAVQLWLRRARGAGTDAELVEGVPGALVEGPDGRVRVRVAIASTSAGGEVVEVRVPLDRVERVVCEALGQELERGVRRAATGSRAVVRRPTLEYGMPAVTPAAVGARPVGARSSGVQETLDANDTWQEPPQGKIGSTG